MDRRAAAGSPRAPAGVADPTLEAVSFA
jgi:hypothetical protein